MSIGKLSLKSTPSLRVRWTIPDFFQLAAGRAYSLLSPDFAFADLRYRLRLLETRENVQIELLSLNHGRDVLYEVQVKSGTGEKDVHRAIHGNRVGFFFPRLDLEGGRDLYVPHGTLILLCSLRTPSDAGSPKSGGHRPRYVGELSSETTPSLYVEWTIERFFREARKSTRPLESPEFDISGRRHRLRLVQSGVCVQIHLVNWSDTDPGRFVSYEVGFKTTTGLEIHIDRYGSFTTRCFYISRGDLDNKESECFPDGHLTVFCCVGSRKPSGERSPMSTAAETSRSKDPVPQAADRTKPTAVQTSNEKGDEEGLPDRPPSSTMRIGYLAFDSPPSLRLTWSIPDFLELATGLGYSLQSPDFPFADSRYGLRLFQTLDSDVIKIELLSLTDPDSGRAVLYEVQFKSRTGERDMHLNRRDNSVEFFYPRSDLYVPLGTLTLLCSVRPRTASSAGSPMSGGDRPRYIPPHRRTGKLSSESTPSLYVKWTIPGYFRLARRSTHPLESPEFDISGRRHRLRLDQTADCVRIRLASLSDSNPGRYVSCEVGLKTTTGEEIHMCRNDLHNKESECFPDGHLTVFCCVGSRKPSSEGSPMPGAAETSRSKHPLLHAADRTEPAGVQSSKEEGDEEGLPETTNSVSCGIQTEIPEIVSSAIRTEVPESVSCAIQTEVPESASSAIQTEVPESVSCAVQTEIPESVSCAIQTEVPDDQKHSQDEKASSSDKKGVANYYKYFLQAA